jgi:hypothetical protein
LDGLGVRHHKLSEQADNGIFSMARELISRNRQLSRLVRTESPDVLSGVGGTCAAQVGFLTRRPSVVFYNTELAHIQNLLTYPFATKVVVSTSYTGWTPKRRTKTYRGYHELSYLHPLRYRADLNVAIDNGLAEKGPSFLIRLVSWNANHDFGRHGWTPKTLESVVERLSRNGKVLISSESKLPEKFQPFQYKGDVSAIHDVLAHCRLYVGESATMASEAAVMGVPAIYAAPSFRGYVNEQETRYGLTEFVDSVNASRILEAIDRMLERDEPFFRERHARLLNECVDVAEMARSTIIQVGHRFS